jgi:hypothetical protein
MGKVFGLAVPDIADDRLGHSSEKEIIAQAAEFSAQRPKTGRPITYSFPFACRFSFLARQVPCTKWRKLPMPYLRLHLPEVPIEQKRVIAQKLIEITMHAFPSAPKNATKYRSNLFLSPNRTRATGLGL